MLRAPKKFIFRIGFLALIFASYANAQEVTKETVIVTDPDSSNSVVVTTPATTTPTTSTTTSVSTPTSTTTTTKETVVTTPARKEVIITPAPEAKEVLIAPTGFVNCFTVAAGWFNNEWIPQHQICQYENSPQGVSWVEGYWACTEYKVNEGICTNWDWRPGHWTKTLTVY